MTVRKSLPYQGIARRAINQAGNGVEYDKNGVEYDKNIDISAMEEPKPRRFTVIDRSKPSNSSKDAVSRSPEPPQSITKPK